MSLLRLLPSLGMAAVLTLPLAACGADDEPSSPAALASTSAPPTTAGPASATSAIEADVTASFYPLAFLAQRVGGDSTTVTNLTTPGAEPHDLELTPSQVASLSETDLVVYLTDFQPAVDEAVEQRAEDKALDVATVVPLSDGYVPLEEGEFHEDEQGKDPHVWLDPTLMSQLADATAERMGQVNSSGAADYRRGAEALKTELAELDGEFSRGLATCGSRDLVVSHNAFGYLAKRYQLNQVPIAGLTPEEEPSARRVAEVSRLAKEKGVTTIFYETLVSPDIAQTIARETGAQTAVLDPIEGLEEDSRDDYFSVMRTNLSTLRTALDCS